MSKKASFTGAQVYAKIRARGALANVGTMQSRLCDIGVIGGASGRHFALNKEIDELGCYYVTFYENHTLDKMSSYEICLILLKSDFSKISGKE